MEIVVKTFTELRLEVEGREEELRVYREHVGRYRSAYTTQHELVGKRIWVQAISIPPGTHLNPNPYDDRKIVFNHGFGQPANGTAVLFRAFEDKGVLRATPHMRQKGLVCQCWMPIPAGLTYFKIVKVHILGKTVIVKPVVGSVSELFEQVSR